MASPPPRQAAPSAAAAAAATATNRPSSSTSTGSSTSNGSSLALPVGTQPDMVLAWEKDGFYAKQIHSQMKVGVGGK